MIGRRLIAVLTTTAAMIALLTTPSFGSGWAGSVSGFEGSTTVTTNAPGTLIDLKFTQPLSGYVASIYDQDGRRVQLCSGGSYMHCATYISVENGTTRSFTGYVALDAPRQGFPTQDVQGSATISVTNVGWTGAISKIESSAPFVAPDGLSALDVRLTAPLSGYRVSVYDQDSRLIKVCSGSDFTHCPLNVSVEAGLAGVFTAYVALDSPSFAPPKNDVHAKASVVVVGTRFDASAAAAALASKVADMQDPCIEIAPPEPHTNPTSLSDPQAQCEADLEAGKSWIRIIERLINSYGIVTSIMASVSVNDGPTQVASPPGSTANPAPTPVYTMPTFEDHLLAEGSTRIMTSRSRVSGYGFEADPEPETTAQAVYAQCLRFATFAGSGITTGDCETKAILAPGSDISEATIHDFDVIYKAPSVVGLSMLTGAEKSGAGVSRDWYNRSAYSATCPSPRPDGLHCDEYPYYTSEEGGPQPDGGLLPDQLRLIDSSDNGREGVLLNGFYSACGIASAPRGSSDREYLVIPLPYQSNIPTAAYCAPGR